MIQEKICTVAVVGAGYMAREHIRAFADFPNVRIAGITSRTKARAELLAAEYNIPHVCDSVDELYEKTKADLVVVCVPELAANQVSRSVFEYPWTALLEKPVGYDLNDAEEITAMAKSKNRKAFVALNRRYYSSTRAVLSDMQQNEDIRFIHIQDQEDPKRALEAGQPKLVVENWMFANSVHVIDYFYMFGRGKIVAVEPIIPWQPKSPWIVVAKVLFDSGDIGLYEGIWSGPGPWSASINTAKKRWEMRPLEQAAFQLDGQRKLEQFPVDSTDQKFKPGLWLQAQEAISAALGKPTDLPTLDDALRTMKLVGAIFKHGS